MENRHPGAGSGQPLDAAGVERKGAAGQSPPSIDALENEAERAARQRLFDEVLGAVELVLDADGAAFWREEPDHSLGLMAHASMPAAVLEALDRRVVTPLQSIMQRWPETPLVAVPLAGQADSVTAEIRAVCEAEGIPGLVGIPCRVAGETLGLLVVIHRRPQTWTVRDVSLATGLAGQLATAMQNARLFSSVRSLASRLTAIHELSLRLAQLTEVNAIVEAIVSEVGRLVDCDTVRVYRPDPADGVFRLVAAAGTFAGLNEPSLQALAGAQVETLPGWVAKRNEPLIIPDVSVERRAIVRSSSGPESLLLVPMSYGRAVQGVLVVSKGGLNRYGPDDEQALSILARYAGQAILSAENLERLARQQVQLERQLAGERQLLHVSERLVSTLDPEGVLDEIADTIGSVVRYDRLTIYRLDRSSGRIEAVVSRSDSGAGQVAGEPALAEGLTSWVIGRGDAVCANDVAEGVLATGPDDGDKLGAAGFAEAAAGPAGTDRVAQNIIVVPLRVRGEVVGSLNLMRIGGPEARFSEPEFELGKLFAGQASLALQNAEAHLIVASRADLDALTGLRNHGTFQRDLAALIEAGDPFTLLMMDLNSFKAFNDTYGHPAGDALLRAVARAIVGVTRQDDRAYRYGGDEFAVLLLGTTASHSREVAGRIRTAVRGTSRHLTGPAAAFQVSACLGVAHWPADGRSKTSLVRAADEALYAAKRLRAERPSAEAENPPETAPWALFDAAGAFIAAVRREQVAEITARHAAALARTPDAFVALLVPAGPASTAGPKVMRQLAGRGRFVMAPTRIRRGAGLWGRVWLKGETLSQDGDASGARLGLPLLSDGQVAGLVGLAGPRLRDLRPEQVALLGRLAVLAGAALERVSGPPSWSPELPEPS
jgi:diguanylate cyclase (GGDEF)-like protein